MNEQGWVVIDGAEGEGGGQPLRTSLTLSMLTGTPFEMIHIRAKRPNPGLQAQHLQALLAAQRICDATLEGAVKGSMQVRFIPGEPRSGAYRFDIGTAGANDGRMRVNGRRGLCYRIVPPSDVSFTDNVLVYLTVTAALTQ